MKEWELARYLIDAKKNIDSIIYIEQNIDELSYINVKDIIKNIQKNFYLNLCYILDDVYQNGKKKEICKNQIIDSVYKERDKDKAHKDKNYIKPIYNSIEEMINVMKNQILEVRKVCYKDIPSILTLDFVPHDKELFRLIHGLNKSEEEKIKQKKYNKTLIKGNNTKKIFDDTEDIKNINSNEIINYAVLMKDGINLYEGIQERQDSCINLNVLFNRDLWVRFNEKNRKIIEQLIENGLIDEYGIPIPKEKINKKQIDLFNSIIRNVGDMDD